MERPPALIFLNCCLSGAAPAPDARDAREGFPKKFLDVGRRALEAGVPYVVATLTSVYDGVAKRFMAEFFKRLLRGEDFSVAGAMVAARRAVLQDQARSGWQTFFQFLLFSNPGEAHGLSKASPEPSPPRPKTWAASTEHRPPGVGDVRRNRLLVDADRIFRDGARVIGFHGVGGLGKTMAGIQIEDRLLRHPDDALRVDHAIWVTLRQADRFFDQWVAILQGAGHHDLAADLRKKPDLNPVAFARALGERFGPKVLLTLDNAESLLDGEGVVAPAMETVMEFFVAIVNTTGWKALLTARERFGFSREGRELLAVRWERVPELGLTERVAIVESKAVAVGLDLQKISPEARRRLERDIAPHPYAVNLLLKNSGKEGLELEAQIEAVLARIGEYCALDHYIGRLDRVARHLLETLVLVEEPEPVGNWLWCFLSGVLEPSASTAAADAETAESTALELHLRGLVEGNPRENCHLLPVVADYLRHRAADRPAEEVWRQRHSRLARAFAGMAKGLANAKEEASGEAAADASGQRRRSGERLWRRAVFHSLEANEVCASAFALEQMISIRTGELPVSIAVGFIGRIHNTLESMGDAGCGEPEGLAWGCLANSLQALREFDAALECHRTAIRIFTRANPNHKSVGTAHHQIGNVHFQRRLPIAPPRRCFKSKTRVGPITGTLSISACASSAISRASSFTAGESNFSSITSRKGIASPQTGQNTFPLPPGASALSILACSLNGSLNPSHVLSAQ